MSDKMLTHRKSRFVVNPSQSSVKTSVNKVNWSHRLSIHTCPPFYWIVPPPSSRLSLSSFFSLLQFMPRINSGNSILSCSNPPPNKETTGLFAPEWHFLPWAPLFSLFLPPHTHDHTLLTNPLRPTLFRLLCQFLLTKGDCLTHAWPLPQPLLPS